MQALPCIQPFRVVVALLRILVKWRLPLSACLLKLSPDRVASRSAVKHQRVAFPSVCVHDNGVLTCKPALASVAQHAACG